MCCLREKNAFGLVSVFSPGGVLERWGGRGGNVVLNRHVCHNIKCAHVEYGHWNLLQKQKRRCFGRLSVVELAVRRDSRNFFVANCETR